MRATIGLTPVLVLCLIYVTGDADSARRADPKQPLTLRVLSYNIQHGAGMDGKVDLERQAEVIKALKPDLVALQEVDNKTKRTQLVDQAGKLGELTGTHAVFGKAMDFDGGGYGEAVLSTFPIIESKTHPLPAEQDHEPRALLEVLVQVGKEGPKLRFFGTHLCHQSAKERMRQIEAIEKAAGDDAKSLMILAGDLNDQPDSDGIKRLLKNWTDASADKTFLTYPADKPKKKLDYVLYRPAKRLRLIESKVIEEAMASDHRPVLSVLEIVPE